jgi:hypothetical protein
MQFEGYLLFVRSKGKALSRAAMIRLGIEVHEAQAKFHTDPYGIPMPWRDGHYEITLKDPAKLDWLKRMVSERGMAIICWLPRHVRYAGDWDELMPILRAARRHNYLFQVDLPPEEYERLVSGGLDVLKQKMPANVAALVDLSDNDAQAHGKGPVLILNRIGA